MDQPGHTTRGPGSAATEPPPDGHVSDIRAARVIAVFGPTGSGKTDVAVALAHALGTEVVNCDPAQCYAGLPVLTNQPDVAHDAVAAHRMIAVWPITHEATAAAFAREVHTTIDELVAQRGVAVTCGGSGLYLRSALSDLAFGAADQTGERDHDAARSLRATLEHDYEQRGGTAMLARVAELDPDAAAGLHPSNAPRVIRALETALAGGTVTGGMWSVPYRHPTHAIGLQVDRALVRARIDARTDAMWCGGLVDEVVALVGTHAERLDDRSTISSTAAKLHGLSDVCAHLRGDLTAIDARDRMATRTRQYAKRQDTWGRRWPGLQPAAVADDPAAAAEKLLERNA